MKKKEKIEQEIEKTLSCFEKSERLEGDAWFYNRVKAEIDNPGHKRFGLQTIWPILKPALLVLIAAINIFTISSYFASPETVQEVSREQMVIEFAKTFSLNSTSNNLFIFEN